MSTRAKAAENVNVRIKSMMGRPATSGVVLIEAPIAGGDRTNLHGKMYPKDVVTISTGMLKDLAVLLEGERACIEVTDAAANRPLAFPTKTEMLEHRKMRLKERQRR